MPLNAKQVVEEAKRAGFIHVVGEPMPTYATATNTSMIIVKTPAEAGIAKLPNPEKKRQSKPDPSLRKWLTKGEARKMGYYIP